LLRLRLVRKQLCFTLCIGVTLVAVSASLLSGCFWRERREPYYEEHRHHDRDRDRDHDRDHDREEHHERRHD